MSSISSRIQFLIRFGHVPAEMWDFIVPMGPVLKSQASKELAMAGILRDISYQITDKEIAHELKSAGAEMVKFASENLINGYEDGDDWCPLYPHIPHFGHGPQPGPWFSEVISELNPQPLPPQAVASALLIVARFTSLQNVAERLKEIGSYEGYNRR